MGSGNMHRVVASLLHRNIQSKAPNTNSVVEIEARLGTLVDKETKSRIYLPVSSDVVLSSTDHDWYHFDPSIPSAIHGAYNELFNAAVVASKKSGGPKEVSYSHTRCTDIIEHCKKGNKRLTLSESKQRLCATHKEKLEHIDIYVPNAALDVRITVSIETALDVDTAVESHLVREKDRRSYVGGDVTVDLTQTRHTEHGGAREIHNELELEWTDAKALALAQKKILTQNDLSDYQSRVAAFVDKSLLVAQKESILI